MTVCAVCATPAIPERATRGPWCCSLVCYNTFHHVNPPASPLCHDAVTMICPVCQHPFMAVGRQKFCSDACRAAAYRRRRDAGRPPVTIPKARPRTPVTVYECGTCGTRTLGQQRCEECGIFMHRIGIGGNCPSCDQPVAVTELLGQEVTTTN